MRKFDRRLAARSFPPPPPAKGLFGLSVTDVQMLMGHDSIKTTAKYARGKADRLMAKLQQSDEAILGLDKTERSLLPLAVLENLEASSD